MNTGALVRQGEAGGPGMTPPLRPCPQCNRLVLTPAEVEESRRVGVALVCAECRERNTVVPF